LKLLKNLSEEWSLMNYIEHAVIGVGTASAGVMAARFLGLPEVAPTMMIAGTAIIALGSIAVDIDHPKSFISFSIPRTVIPLALKIFPIILALCVYLFTQNLQESIDTVNRWVVGFPILQVVFFVLVLTIGLLVASWIITGTLEHRGPLHSLLFTFAITIAAAILSVYLGYAWWWGLFFGWGWLMHILADATTASGVPIRWPFISRRDHLWPAPHFDHAGTIWFFVAAIVIILNIWGYVAYYLNIGRI
jgi:membrane-bound metal-dependent hydrolase YbcI (DUF457 family)